MQLSKAESPILIIEEGIVTCANDEHCAKAQFPIFVTEEGIDISTSDFKKKKTYLSIFITEGEIIVLICGSEIKLLNISLGMVSIDEPNE